MLGNSLFGAFSCSLGSGNIDFAAAFGRFGEDRDPVGQHLCKAAVDEQLELTSFSIDVLERPHFHGRQKRSMSPEDAEFTLGPWHHDTVNLFADQLLMRCHHCKKECPSLQLLRALRFHPPKVALSRSTFVSGVSTPRWCRVAGPWLRSLGSLSTLGKLLRSHSGMPASSSRLRFDILLAGLRDNALR